jgi:hypothetical protein
MINSRNSDHQETNITIPGKVLNIILEYNGVDQVSSHGEVPLVSTLCETHLNKMNEELFKSWLVTVHSNTDFYDINDIAAYPVIPGESDDDDERTTHRLQQFFSFMRKRCMDDRDFLIMHDEKNAENKLQKDILHRLKLIKNREIKKKIAKPRLDYLFGFAKHLSLVSFSLAGEILSLLIGVPLIFLSGAVPAYYLLNRYTSFESERKSITSLKIPSIEALIGGKAIKDTFIHTGTEVLNPLSAIAFGFVWLFENIATASAMIIAATITIPFGVAALVINVVGGIMKIIYDKIKYESLAREIENEINAPFAEPEVDQKLSNEKKAISTSSNKQIRGLIPSGAQANKDEKHCNQAKSEGALAKHYKANKLFKFSSKRREDKRVKTYDTKKKYTRFKK